MCCISDKTRTVESKIAYLDDLLPNNFSRISSKNDNKYDIQKIFEATDNNILLYDTEI